MTHSPLHVQPSENYARSSTLWIAVEALQAFLADPRGAATPPLAPDDRFEAAQKEISSIYSTQYFLRDFPVGRPYDAIVSGGAVRSFFPEMPACRVLEVASGALFWRSDASLRDRFREECLSDAAYALQALMAMAEARDRWSAGTGSV